MTDFNNAIADFLEDHGIDGIVIGRREISISDLRAKDPGPNATGQDMCELIAKVHYERTSKRVDPESIWTGSGTGELYHVLELYEAAMEWLAVNDIPSLDRVNVSGRGKVYIIQLPTEHPHYENPRGLKDTRLLIDGKPFHVLGVETFCVPDGHPALKGPCGVQVKCLEPHKWENTATLDMMPPIEGRYCTICGFAQSRQDPPFSSGKWEPEA